MVRGLKLFLSFYVTLDKFPNGFKIFVITYQHKNKLLSKITEQDTASYRRRSQKAAKSIRSDACSWQYFKFSLMFPFHSFLVTYVIETTQLPHQKSSEK